MKEIIRPDKQKAKALLHMALQTLQRLTEIPLQKYPTNSLIDLYDSIHKLADGICLSIGIRFRGEKSHFELIQELKELEVISQSELSFLQQIRTYRNSIQYEGFTITEDFIFRNKTRFESIILKLQEKLESSI